jgi:glutaminase
MNLDTILAGIAADITEQGAAIEAAADAKQPDAAPGPFGIAVATLDGRIVAAGAADRFPIQSISKALALDLALDALGEAVFDRVGREPSGDPFNSVVDLERTAGIPRNPFINAGALVIVDMLVERYGDGARDAVHRLIRERTSGEVTLDQTVLDEPTELNRAMLSFMRHHGNIDASNDAIIDAYLHQCAITVDVRGLAEAGRPLADTRRDPQDPAKDRRAKRMRAVLGLMMTCGHYDASGDLALRVGLPAKSGVGGGILAVMPGIASIAVWSPNLDQHGNSILGLHGLEMLAERTGWSVFGPPLGKV